MNVETQVILAKLKQAAHGHPTDEVLLAALTLASSCIARRHNTLNDAMRTCDSLNFRAIVAGSWTARAPRPPQETFDGTA